MQFLKKLYRSFPIQLLVIQLKKHQLLLFFWLLLFLMATNNIGSNYGIPYLFLDPEYLGEVGYLSFSLIGIAFGGFLVTWNVSFYLLNSNRFPFLASLRWPFAMFVLNNSLLPIAFTVVYLTSMVLFQNKFEFKTTIEIVSYALGFLAGTSLTVLVSAIYFQSTNSDIFFIVKKNHIPLKSLRKKLLKDGEKRWKKETEENKEWQVSYYLTSRLKVRATRNVEHYDESLLDKVFKQHHYNALLVQVLILMVLIGLGFFIEYKIFQIPAMASVIFMFAIMTSIAGFFRFWSGKWSTSALIILFVVINVATRFGSFGYDNKAFGLNYETEKAEYSVEKLESLSTPSIIENDIEHSAKILDNWKEKVNQGKSSNNKPKLIILNASGGGLRSALFSMAIMQEADSITNGKLLNQTVMMTGASGGMIGLGYLRELYYQKQKGVNIDLYAKKHLDIIGMDLLNPICITIVTNDVFFPWQQFKVGDYTYRKDRGYIMEQTYIDNTNGLMDKPISTYQTAEQDGTIPMWVSCATILNDLRKLVVCAQPVSYMMKPVAQVETNNKYEIDAVDFGALFKEQDAYNLRLSTAIRMNATFPYILPNTHLPSEPTIDVIDAGTLDNLGVDVSVRYIMAMQDWIEDNTSGVVIVQLRDSEKFEEIEKMQLRSFVSKVMSPIDGVYNNMTHKQDREHDYLINFADECIDVPLDIVRFEYVPSEKDKKAAMSLHLTSEDKRDVLNSIHSLENKHSYKRLQELLND